MECFIKSHLNMAKYGKSSIKIKVLKAYTE